MVLVRCIGDWFPFLVTNITTYNSVVKGGRIKSPCLYPVRGGEVPLFIELPRETVRKAPISFKLKPHKPSKRVEQAPFSLLKPCCKGLQHHPRPFSDSL
jgi:hypothetical protein